MMTLNKHTAACVGCIMLLPTLLRAGEEVGNPSPETIIEATADKSAPETAAVKTAALNLPAPAPVTALPAEVEPIELARIRRSTRTGRLTPELAPEPEATRRWLARPGLKGLSFEAVLTLEYIANVSGGISQDTALLGNFDLAVELDTAEAGLWDGGTFLVYGLGNFNGGTLPTEIIGDIQATSNIEAPETFKLYEAWYNHSFLDDRLAILVGLHDYNSEFDVMEYAGVFPNSSFGIAPQISQVGPSIFPTTALALRIAAKPTDGSYVLAAVYDGVPGDPDDDTSSAIQFNDGDGVFTGVEAGLRAPDEAARYYKVAIGGWYLTAEAEDFTGAVQDNRGGLYLMAEAQVYQEAADDGQGLGLFAQYGNTFENFNEIDYSLIGGANYTGLIPGRDEDVIALGVTSAFLCDEFRALEGNEGLARAETVIELVYEAAISDRITIRPDMQYIINPLSEPGIDDALQLGLRVEIGL
jgi:porin